MPPRGGSTGSLAHWANFADRESFHRSLWTPSQPTRGRHRRKIIGSESVRYFWFPRPSWLGRPPAGGYEFGSNTQTFPRLWGMSNKCTPCVSPWCKIRAFLYSFLFSRLRPKRGNSFSCIGSFVKCQNPLLSQDNHSPRTFISGHSHCQELSNVIIRLNCCNSQFLKKDHKKIQRKKKGYLK